MTVCVIKVCRNYKGRSKTTKKVTYHRIPSDPILRSRWIDVIGKSRNEELWQPTKNSVVCSDHFHRQDIYFTKEQGRPRLKKGTVPLKGLFLSSLQSDGSDVSYEEADTSGGGNERNTFKEAEPTVNVEAGPSGVTRNTQHPTSLELEDTSSAANAKDEFFFNTLNETENETEILQDFSDLDSIFDTPRKFKLRRELRRKIALQKNM